jgi:7-carboxy-7-deazaguanine synthase
MADALVINEIYLSLQGESTFAGWPCVFIRFTGCDLRCSYCDTPYAFSEGQRIALEQILAKVDQLAIPYPRHRTRLPLVELTGGEPLLQPGSLTLMSRLCNAGYTVLLETSGAHDIQPVDSRVHRIVDLKCPSSGEMERNRWSNLDGLKSGDEIKFVLASQEDYAWACGVLRERNLAARCPVLFSWASPAPADVASPQLKPFPANHTRITRRELAERVIADALSVRFQVQMHQVIWPAERRGV